MSPAKSMRRALWVVRSTTTPSHVSSVRTVAGVPTISAWPNEHNDTLRQRGIVYAPDFVINAGGLINVAAERTRGLQQTRVLAKVWNIPRTLRGVLDTAQRRDISQRSVPLSSLPSVSLARGPLPYSLCRRPLTSQHVDASANSYGRQSD